MLGHSFARRLYELLNSPSTAKAQYQPTKNNPEGSYAYGHARPIQLRSFEKHLAGRSTQALSVVTGGFANFVCWDVDEYFETVRASIAHRLQARGWDQAAFTTTGSNAGRGKVILTFKPRIPQAVAHKIADSILQDVRAEINSSSLFAIGDKSLDAFPTLGMGGNLRILGRNKARNGPLEEVLTLDGKPTDLRYVRPVRIDYDRTDAVTSQPAQWASRLIESSSIVQSNDEAYKVQIRLADEALRLSRDDEARAIELLGSWSADLAARSSGNAARQFKRKDAADRAVRYVIANRRGPPAISTAGWIPLDLSDMKGRKGSKRIYEGLAGYATSMRLNPHCFGMDYGRLAAIAGYKDKSRTKRSADAAEDQGLLFRLDRGSKNGDNERGLVTLYCLRGAGESLQDAYDDGTRSEMYLERMQLTGEPRIRLVGGKKIGFRSRMLTAS